MTVFFNAVIVEYEVVFWLEDYVVVLEKTRANLPIRKLLIEKFLQLSYNTFITC